MDLNFIFDSQLSCWKANTEFHGNKIEIRQFSPELRPSKTKSELAKETIEKVNCNWDKIETAIVASLLELHNEEWAEPEDGFPVLKKHEFLKRIIHQTIDLDIEDEYEDSITMYFSDSGIFGNHSIQLFWHTDEDIDVSLVG